MAEPTLRDFVAAAAERLSTAGIDGAALDARVLARAAVGIDPRLEGGRLLTPQIAAAFEAMIARRAAREPVSRILGRREFWSLEFQLSPATLDPRPDSETLVEAVLKRVDRRRPLRILDLGTGSGCLLLALLSELPEAFGMGLDRSFEAAITARANAKALGLADRATFMVGSWVEALAGGRFDVAISNPPYIAAPDLATLAPELAHDPALALDGGADGLVAYRAIIPELPRLLAADGLAALEIGSDQAEPVTALMLAAGLAAEPVIPDLAGLPRVVVGAVELDAGESRAQAMVRRHIPDGSAIVDELIAERRAASESE